MPTAPRSTRPRSSADGGDAMNKRIVDVGARRGALAARRSPAARPRPHRRRGRAQGRGDDEGVVQGDAARPKLDRLDQDETQRLCTPVRRPRRRPRTSPRRSRRRNLASIKWPADGKYLGDWKNGEKIAQEGRGKQYSRRSRRGPSAATATRATSSRRRRSPTARSARACTTSARSAATATDMQKYAYGKVYNARGLHARAPTCRASATTAS